MIIFRGLTVALLVATLASATLAQSKPAISSEPPTYSTANGTLFVYLPIANAASIEAGNVQVTSATVAKAKLLTPAFPLAIGNLASGSSYGLTLTFNPTGLVSGKIYLVTVHGTYQTSAGTVPFSLNQSIKYGNQSPFAQPVKPLTVAPTLDNAHSTSQVISAATGGTITTTGTDGSVFRLSIPPNALLSDEPVIMTPLSAVAGLPVSGGLLAGVQFSPEGLQFQQPATLTIQPATSVPTSEQIGFGYHGGGQDFYLQPFQSKRMVTISILHFSGAGIARGNPLNNVGNSTVADALSQEAALDINIGNHCMGAVACLLAMDALEGLTQEYYVQVVQPLVEQALTDATVAQTALQAMTVWANQVEVLGYATHQPFDSELETINSQILQILLNLYNTTLRNCASEPSQKQRFKDAKTLLQVINYFQVRTGKDPSPNWQTEVASCYAGALNFSLDSKVNTTTTIPTPPGDITQKTDSEVTVPELPLKFTPAALGYQDDGVLHYPVFTFSAVWPSPIGDCSSGMANGPGTIQVSGTIDLNFFSASNLSDVTMHLSITPKVSETVVLGVYGPMVPCQAATHQTAYYVSGLNIAHGNMPTETPQPTLYVMPLNSTMTFTDSGTYSTSTSTIVANENTQITLQQAGE